MFFWSLPLPCAPGQALETATNGEECILLLFSNAGLDVVSPLFFCNILKLYTYLFLCSAGKLKTVLLCCPEIFTMHQRDIDSIVGVLKEKCLFTVQQVTKILHRCPYVLREDPGELEYKFQVRMTSRGFGK